MPRALGYHRAELVFCSVAAIYNEAVMLKLYGRDIVPIDAGPFVVAQEGNTPANTKPARDASMGAYCEPLNQRSRR